MTFPMPAVIGGDRSLPAGYRHPHASEEARALAEQGLILRAQVGSGVHGTSISGQDDRDEMGICLEPPSFVTGVARVPRGIAAASTVAFEQFQRHTVWDRPGGLANRSGAGDLDVVVYAARKWARLALAGNPTVLLVLFVPDEEVVFRNEAGAELVANAHRFVSRAAADRFLGYLRSQRDAMTGRTGAHTNRPELVAAHGYDTTFACTRCGWGCRVWSCCAPGASPCRCRSRTCRTCGRSGAARCRSPRWSRRSTGPSGSCWCCGSPRPCRTSPTGRGWTGGCTGRTCRTGRGRVEGPPYLSGGTGTAGFMSP